MDTRFVADVETWERRPFDGGFDGLRRLAEASFSGAVRTGRTYLFLVGGRPVGVFDYEENPRGEDSVSPASIDAFEDAGGEAFTAPHRALSLLAVMQASGGETRGRYYSNDTPIAEVDRTLREGGFTGYLELSENVLSGDYYLVYHRGSRQSVAFVGQSRRLKTDEEAFDLADDEVGIYEVTGIDLPRLELPEPAEPEVPRDPIVPTGDEAEADDDERSADDSAPDPDPDTRPDPAPESEPVPADDTAVEAAIEQVEEAVEAESEAEAEAAGEFETGTGTETETGTETATSDEPAFDPTAPVPESAAESAEEPAEAVEEPTEAAAGEPSESAAGEPSESEVEATPEDVAAATAAVETEAETETEASTDDPTDTNGEGGLDGRVVPSVDPARTARGAEPTPESTPEQGEVIVDGETVDGLRRELAARDDEVAALKERLEAVERERDELQAEVEALERRLSAAGVPPESPERSLTAKEALGETSVFVRYRSKRDPTLADAHDGAASPEAVAENLRLDWHTQFDADAVAVDGRSFEAFLEDTLSYAFVRWLVEDLVYEIRDTGNAGSMRALYDALPSLDRIEFASELSVAGETVRFDVVGRDRMGTPLLVANLEDSRDPTDEVTMADLVNATTAYVQDGNDLAGAFAVTASYFEPAALETADEATGGSLLSRDQRKSFVKLSRKQGYHLCLVEAREDSFYLSVPEL
jgi:hypothetical protein